MIVLSGRQCRRLGLSETGNPEVRIARLLARISMYYHDKKLRKASYGLCVERVAENYWSRFENESTKRTYNCDSLTNHLDARTGDACRRILHMWR